MASDDHNAVALGLFGSEGEQVDGCATSYINGASKTGDSSRAFYIDCIAGDFYAGAVVGGGVGEGVTIEFQLDVAA